MVGLCVVHRCLFLAVARARSVLGPAFDGYLQNLWDFPVPHDRKKMFGKSAGGACLRHGVCICCWHEACV